MLSQPCVLCTLDVRVCACLSGQKRNAARTEGPVQDRATRTIRVALSLNCLGKKIRANETPSECERRAKTSTSQNGLRANARDDHIYRMQGVLCILEPYVRPWALRAKFERYPYVLNSSVEVARQSQQRIAAPVGVAMAQGAPDVAALPPQ